MLKRTIEHDVAELNNQPIKYLRELWQSYFDEPAPVYNRATLINRLSYRMQEVEYGGLNRRTINELLKYAEENVRKRKRPDLALGTILIREYGNEEHRVTVTPDGYRYKDKTYKSLSGVAKAITGTIWNGKTFFGLKKDTRK